ncbi:MAG: DUF1922 domain-containing protein [Candidatus Hecatellales archaeon]|nr:MAG: DUF1922 domain-containing protein [Candidatus Hecatellales archaeon]
MFKCRVCGKLNLSKDKQKTKVCVFCGAKNDLSRVRILAKGLNRFEARQTISRLKVYEAKPKFLKQDRIKRV